MNAIEKITQSFFLIAENLESVSLPYLKELEGSTKQRVHNKGKDSEGNIIGIKGKNGGKYSPGYEKKKGKKVGNGNLYPINLQYKGDLFREFTVGLESGKYVLKFQTELSSIKVAAAEKNYKTDIYKPSDDQLDDAKEVLVEGVKDFLKELF
jgi:hypothetical protein